MSQLGTIARAPFLAAIALYRVTLSPLIGANCRHLPTCSDYAREAIETNGAWKGGWLTLARLCRCHPWGNHGFDPVPEHLPAGSSWLRPWRFGDWRGPLHCEDIAAREAMKKAPDEPAQQAAVRGLHEEKALKQDDRARF